MSFVRELCPFLGGSLFRGSTVVLILITLSYLENFTPSKGRSASVDDRNTSYSYIKFTAENKVQHKSKIGITPTASLHDIQEISSSPLLSRGAEELLSAGPA